MRYDAAHVVPVLCVPARGAAGDGDQDALDEELLVVCSHYSVSNASWYATRRRRTAPLVMFILLPCSARNSSSIVKLCSTAGMLAGCDDARQYRQHACTTHTHTHTRRTNTIGGKLSCVSRMSVGATRFCPTLPLLVGVGYGMRLIVSMRWLQAVRSVSVSVTVSVSVSVRQRRAVPIAPKEDAKAVLPLRLRGK